MKEKSAPARKTKLKMAEKNIEKIVGKIPLKPDKSEQPRDKFFEAVREFVWLNTFMVIKGATDWCLGGVYCADFYILKVSKKRSEVVATRNHLIDAFQRDLGKVKADLDVEWARRVRRRDGHVCVRCGSTKTLTAHHWCRNKHNSRSARWSLDNGITLCFGCHLRQAHENPDYLLYRSFLQHFQIKKDYQEDIANTIEKLSNAPVTDKFARSLWHAWGLHDPKGIYSKKLTNS